MINKYLEFTPAALCWYLGQTNRELTLIVADNETAQQVYSDFKFFGIDANWFPDWDVLPFEALSPSESISAQRISFLTNPAQVSIIVVSALLRKVSDYKKLKSEISVSSELSRESFAHSLLSLGYIQSTLVEELGQFSVRGSVVDVFISGTENPIRIEFEDDTIESIRTFDPASQRSIGKLQNAIILPLREVGDYLPIGKSYQEFNHNWKQYFSKFRQLASELSLSSSAVESLTLAFESGIFPQGFEHLWPIISTDLDAPIKDLRGEVIVYQPAKVEAALESFSAICAEQLLKVSSQARLYPKMEQAFLEPKTVEAILRNSSVYEEVKFYNPNSIPSLDISPSSLGLSSNIKIHNLLAAAKYSDRPLLPFAEEVRKRIKSGYSVNIAVDHRVRKERLRNLLLEYELESEESDLTTDPGLWIVEGRLSSGFCAEQQKIQYYSEYEIFPGTSKRKSSLQNVRKILGDASQLSEGDYVVHVDYGVAIYRGLKQQTIDSQLHDFLLLEYAEGAKLFVPVYALAKVQKYSGAEGVSPELTRLGGKIWEKAKQKVKQNVAELAGRLLKIMAERELKPGISFGDVDSEDRRFADLFPYEETQDQAAAIAAVLADMDKQRPMDRLVCGDVGYGKTEVALRAAFKAVNAGFQVAVLVPTTVLAQQHYQTFKQRFAHFAVRVECLSRFATAQQNKEVLSGVKAGTVDVVIGTHRLLQTDVSFERLGLIIIDEEHRFGVAHKEKLKRYRAEVDILTMTATPIPRTLHMSLVGIRDLSLIETPPVDRQVVRTFVSRYEEKLVREAVLRELNREGQVFFIFNRVQTIAEKAAEIANLVPEARVEFAHGQMKDGELEEVMLRFVNREIDILVSTTIVESGLDIPNANTIIIQDSQNFGLAELYQLRGRVGRSSRRAYAYLFIGDPAKLGDNAKKRLEVLQSLDDLGIGFRLALQDMEIRGAGNLLGKDQSGQINSVGYELYSKILKDAVDELRKVSNKTDSKIPEVDPEISIGFPSHIPPFYIPDVSQRLLLYQRMISVENSEQVQLLFEEIEDRFGNMPEEVRQLLELMDYRTILKRAGVLSANLKNGILRLALHSEIKLDTKKLILEVQKGGFKISPNNALLIAIEDHQSPNAVANETKKLLSRIGILQ